MRVGILIENTSVFSRGIRIQVRSFLSISFLTSVAETDTLAMKSLRWESLAKERIVKLQVTVKELEILESLSTSDGC